MRAFVNLTLFAAWVCAVTASPLPKSKYGDSNKDQLVLSAADDHLFSDGGFPLRVQVHAQEFPGVPDHDGRQFFTVPSLREHTPYSDPFSGFFFNMQDMMKILRDQMSEVLARVPAESGAGHEDRLLPSDVKNQTSTKVEYLDGHKVVINDTTYSNGDANHGSIFHVQIVDLLPLDDPAAPLDPAPPKIHPNEVDSSKPEVDERDREEIEEDAEEVGADIDEVAKKPAKKPETPEAKAKDAKPEEKEAEKGLKVASADPKETKGEKAEKGDKVEKKAAKPDEEVETFDDELGEDVEEGEDNPDKKGILLITVH